MSNLNSIQRAIVLVAEKREELYTLNRLVSIAEREDPQESLFSRDIYILGNTIQLSKEIINTLISVELVVANARQRIQKLEIEIDELTAL